MEGAGLDGKGEIAEDFRTIAIAQADIGKIDQERVLPSSSGGLAAKSESRVGGIIAVPPS
jgi:hypothetical protein